MSPGQPAKKAHFPTPIATVMDLGNAVLCARKEQGLTQLDITGLAQTGNRFIVDLEKGKPTIQLKKALDILELLGLELIIRKKSAK
jgi:HTH-type transcriptional regulator / antitoxin HipB